jgi:putative hydrolase of the HAD superfamily
MRGIKAIWFDLDDTLYDHTYSVRRGMDAIRASYPAFNARDSAELAVLYNRALNMVYTGYVCGLIDFQEMRRRKLQLFSQAAGVEATEIPPMDAFHRIYDEAYCSHRRATPGSVETLTRLRDDGMDLAILTNGKQAVQEDKLRMLGLEWMIPNLLTAERAGTTKPDPRTYQWAMEQTRQVARNVLMVGDSLENDVEAALGCGLNAVLYAPEAREQTARTVHGTVPVIQKWTSLFDLINDAREASATS